MHDIMYWYEAAVLPKYACIRTVCSLSDRRIAVLAVALGFESRLVSSFHNALFRVFFRRRKGEKRVGKVQ